MPSSPSLFEIAPLARHSVVRFPRAEDPLERPFLDAAAQRRQRSIARLTRLIPGIDWAEQANRVDDATLIVASSDRSSLDELRVLEAIDQVGSSHDPGNGLVNLPQPSGGQGPVPPMMTRSAMNNAESRMVAGAVASEVAAGSTLIINGVDRLWEPLRQLSADLMSTFGGGSGTNIYVSSGDTPGFGAHWDDHDVLILHTHGRKYWEVYEPTVLSPDRDIVGPEIGSQLAWSGYLQPGSALYIPRGWGHRVESTEELSVHITTSIRRFSVTGVLNQLLASSTRWPILRADVPFDLSTVPTSYAGSVFDTPDSLAQHIEPLFDDLISKARAASNAAVATTFRQSFAASLQVVVGGSWDTAVVEAPALCGMMIVDDPHDEGALTLAMSGFALRIDSGLAALVAAASVGPTSVADLGHHAPHLETEDLHATIAALVRSGVLHIVSSTS